MYRVLASAVNHPDPVKPFMTLFNHEIVRAISKTDVSLDVVVPRPFAPPVGPYSEYASVPLRDDWGSYTVHHPRFLYLLPKRLFFGLAGRSLQRRLTAYVEANFETPDVVHACQIYLDGYGVMPYCEANDVPFVVVAHGEPFNQFEHLPSGIQRKMVRTLEACSKVLCVSEALAEQARRMVPDSKVAQVPIGASPERYPNGQKTELREEMDIAPDTTVVLFVGQFIERKGIREIIQVLPDLDVTDVLFVFIGWGGDLKWPVQKALFKSPYSARHVYMSITSLALRRWFVMADLFMLPSHQEGRPTVIYEAMASRTPVLGSDVDGIPEQVVDGETGVLIPPKDPDALADALRSLIGDRDRLERMGANGYDRLLEKGWTWSEHANRVREIHEDVMG